MESIPEPYAQAEVAVGLISPTELRNRLPEPGLVIVHVGHGKRGYDQAHLPGARFVDFDEVYVNRDGLAMEMPESDAVEALVARLGIARASTVVLVGDASGVFPARLALTLRHFGFDAPLRLLDGQMRGWIAEGGAVTAEPASWEPDPADEAWSAEVRPGVLVGEEEVADVLAANVPGVVLDVRPENQFSGEKTGPGVNAKGRVEGALNLPWMHMLATPIPPWARPAEELQKLLEAAGVRPTDRVILYDTSGIHASLAWVLLMNSGRDVSVYDGGFEAWSQR